MKTALTGKICLKDDIGAKVFAGPHLDRAIGTTDKAGVHLKIPAHTVHIIRNKKFPTAPTLLRRRVARVADPTAQEAGAPQQEFRTLERQNQPAPIDEIMYYTYYETLNNN